MSLMVLRERSQTQNSAYYAMQLLESSETGETDVVGLSTSGGARNSEQARGCLGGG